MSRTARFPSVWRAGEDQSPGRDEMLGGTEAPSAVHVGALQKQRFTKRQLWRVSGETQVLDST